MAERNFSRKYKSKSEISPGQVVGTNRMFFRDAVVVSANNGGYVKLARPEVVLREGKPWVYMEEFTISREMVFNKCRVVVDHDGKPISREVL